ncbi:glycoside hydrolase family 44 protein, partial [Candidatus Binatia bacterium]|nr:glycoside hydrolase family 44 protein [Candidatus Binatia bacterium]
MRRSWTRSASVAAIALLLCALAARAAAAPLPVYGDALASGFADWSWGTHSLTQAAVVHGGTAAISFEPDGWAGLYLHRDAGIDVATHDTLELWVRGAGAGRQKLSVALLSGGAVAGSAALETFVAGGAIPGGAWAKATVPFAALGVTTGFLDGVWLQDASGVDQATLYVDDVQILASTTSPPPAAPVAVTIDPGANRRPVSRLIYGVNFASPAALARVHYTVQRWGGNSTTRYSWRVDASNHASDWFFYGIPEDNPAPQNLPHGSTTDRFIDDARAAGAEPLITVPLIGWTPKDRSRAWGFSVAKYGAQQETECTATGNAFWCNPDAGNGVRPNGTPITGNDPHDTSVEIGPSFVTDWLAHIASRTGSAAGGGVKLFALDNEPTLWSSTHRDVHPAPPTFDELWQRTVDYASAIKARDPAAQLLGPVPWGWCAYFGSAADDCIDGADRRAHGGLPFLEWYLAQVASYQQAHGVRLIDYLDIHYYPAAAGVTLSDDESAPTAARRLRTLKSLYDPAYVDESWIGEPVRLIPRMREWIAARAPGVKLAITEYSWGNDDGPSSALAQAEALALFAREGVDLATRWVAPAEHSRVEDAFLLYLDYDGSGGTVDGDSVRASSDAPDAVAAYAIQRNDGRLHVLLFNHDTAARDSTVTIAGGTSGSARLFRFAAA